MNPSLVEITDLVKRKQYAQARVLLQDYLEAHPNDAHAWYLLSFAAASPSERLSAIWRAAALAPNNRQVKSRLQQLESQRKRSRFPVLVGLLVVLGVAGVGLFILLRSGARPAPVVPTLAVLPSLEATAEGVVAASVLPSTTPPVLETPVPTAADATRVVTTTEIPLLPTATITVTLRVTTASTGTQPTLELALPTGDPGLPPVVVTQPEAPAPTATLRPAATATLAGPPPTLIPGAAALNSPLNIGSGEMRVVAATRPGDALIREVGGSAVPPPAGQKWLLVELLLVCGSASNCAPDATSLGVLGTSGTVYSPAAGLQIEPQFGAGAYTQGQVWGYTGFTVPDSETVLYLTLTRQGQQHIFALQ